MGREDILKQLGKPVPYELHKGPKYRSGSEARKLTDGPCIAHAADVARRVELHIRHGEWGKAHAVLDEARANARDGVRSDNPTLEQLGLDERTIHTLEKRGISRLSDFRAVTEDDLRAIKTIGALSVTRIREALQRAVAQSRAA